MWFGNRLLLLSVVVLLVLLPVAGAHTQPAAHLDTPECLEKQDCRERRDLLAQESMARWARYMTRATWVQVWIGIITMFGIFLSLHFARASTRAAVQAAAAAIDSMHSDRAWMTFAGVQGRIPHLQSITIALVWKNSGRSPATDVQGEYLMLLVPSDVERANLPLGNVELSDNRGIVAPTDTIVIETVSLEGRDHQDFIAGRKKIVAITSLTYKIVLDTTKLCKTEAL